MDERKHSVLIGAFVVGAFLVAVGAALFFAGAGFGGQRDKVVMVFDGSVKGLNVGAPVALRGVTIGQVTDIQLVLSAEQPDITMIVEAELAADNVAIGGQAMERRELLSYLIDSGLRAQLNMQSVLTGLLYVQMDFHPGSEAVLAEIDSPYAQIPTIPTELEILRRTLQSIDYASMAEAAQSIAMGLRAFVEDDDFRALPGELRAALAALEGAGSGINESLEGLEPKLARALAAVGDAADSVSNTLPGLGGELSQSLARLDEALGATRSAMDGLGGQLAPGSPTVHQLNTTLLELARASRALQDFLQLLEDQPDALLRGRRAEDDS
ncbi:MAG TPA: MlaD family protein [Pseudohaliea sp.]|nr:MlaD family protein [Pseudohaliea sp.]